MLQLHKVSVLEWYFSLHTVRYSDILFLNVVKSEPAFQAFVGTWSASDTNLTALNSDVFENQLIYSEYYITKINFDSKPITSAIKTALAYSILAKILWADLHLWIWKTITLTLFLHSWVALSWRNWLSQITPTLFLVLVIFLHLSPLYRVTMCVLI